MPTTGHAIDELRARLRRYPPERYPVQHATAQFHLGVALSQAGALDEAESAFRTAGSLFRSSGVEVEAAKALNAQGAALRMRGAREDARRAFREAAEIFERAGLGAEQGAAVFNEGLTEREAGELEAAIRSFERALSLLDAQRVPAQAAAAARELGAAQLAAGSPAATATLERAVELARRSTDTAGLGAAANALGLAQLAAGRIAEATESFELSVAANPRSLRAEGFAMAKANLALAYEQAGAREEARLAAAQAISVETVSEPIRLQAEDALARLGAAPGNLLPALARAPSERRPAIVRDELARWLSISESERRVEAREWIAGLGDHGDADDLAEAWLGALLELPPEAMERVIESVLAVADGPPGAVERSRAAVSRSMARFHVPQLLRLKDTFNRKAAALGQEPRWG